MDTPLRASKGYRHQVQYAAVLPLFFFVFIFIYLPFGFEEYYSVGGHPYTFHLLMLTSIMAGILALTRLVFSALYKYIPFRRWHYLVWCFGEVVVCSLFFALYTSLFYRHAGGLQYFVALPYCFEYTRGTMVFPYIVSILVREIRNRDEDLENASMPSDDKLVKFYDEHKRLKLTIDPAAIVYVSAEANYIHIHYMEGDRIKVYELRNSMKSLENTAAGRNLVRCHRSYYVNPRHVKVLSRDKDGVIYTEFTDPAIKRVPVSKLYYESLAKLL
jgi:preprotein translocase subunit Sec61beta